MEHHVDDQETIRLKVAYIVKTARSMGKVADLSKICLAWSDLSHLDLRGVYAQGGDFAGANCEGTDFRWSNLAESNFRYARLVDANMSGSHLPKIMLQGSHADRLILEDVDLSEVDFSWVGLSGVKLLSPPSSQMIPIDNSIPSWKNSEIVDPPVNHREIRKDSYTIISPTILGAEEFW